MSEFDRGIALSEFYDMLKVIAQRVGGPRTLATSDGRCHWPERGVYFFFEDGEMRETRESLRVVRVGTHAITSSSRTTLWNRLAQHKGTVGGLHPGGGSHRGSVFRRHVGKAILETKFEPQNRLETWGQGSTAPSSVREGEYLVEARVSQAIVAMPLLWLPVLDAPGPESDRAVIEAGSISLLSNFNRDPIDSPSEKWLGRASDRREIRESGLWNVRHVADRPSLGFLEIMSSAVEKMGE